MYVASDIFSTRRISHHVDTTNCISSYSYVIAIKIYLHMLSMYILTNNGTYILIVSHTNTTVTPGNLNSMSSAEIVDYNIP